MFGGTLLMISGPCFNQTDSVSLVMSYVKSQINCLWLSQYSVSCIFPPLYRTGQEMVELVIQHDSQTLTFTGIITIGMISTQDEEKQNKTQRNMCWTPLCENKHK